MSPLVSVVIPTYNRAAFVAQAAESVLAQTAGDLELIVVDDGSTDATAASVGRLRDGRLRYVRQANQGRSAARNYGAALAQGECLGFLDSDDRYLPGALAAHLQVFQAQPRLGMTVGGYRYVDAGGQTVGERWPWREAASLDPQGWLFNCLALPGSVLLRRSWFEQAGGFDAACEIAEDWDLFLRLAQAGCPMDWVQEAVCEYRRHPGSSVEAVALHQQGAERMLDKCFGAPGPAPELRALEGPARAWVRVLFARKVLPAGRPGLAAQNLAEALRLDPALAHGRKAALLEFLLTPADGGEPASAGPAALLAALPAELAATPAEVRRAQARVDMGRFFAAAQQRAEAEAWRHLRRGVRRDPRWLANRGVLAFSLRHVLNALRGGAAGVPAP